MDKANFYAALRRKDSGVFGTRLSDKQVSSIEVILDEAIKRRLPLRHTAYVLATAYHEVGSSMYPKVENLNYTSAKRIRAVWPSRFKTEAAARPFVRNPQALANKVYGGRMGNTGPNDGFTYRGRGYPQTTGKENYQESSEIVGVDLVGFPDRMLEPRIAAAAMVESMRRGLYTGRKLADYLNSNTRNYVGARAIINADVKTNGKLVAGYAFAFEQALKEGAYSVDDAAIEDIPVPTPRPANKVPDVVRPAEPEKLNSDLVRKAQELLREKGYPEVGNADGDYGNRTRNAILAFQADNGLPLTGAVTDDLLVSLIKAAPRKNSIERETATEKDLKHEPVVKIGDWIRKIAGGLFASSFLGGLWEGTATFDDITAGVNDMKEMAAALGPMTKWIIAFGVGLTLYHFGSKIIKERVQAYREGRSV